MNPSSVKQLRKVTAYSTDSVVRSAAPWRAIEIVFVCAPLKKVVGDNFINSFKFVIPGRGKE